MLAPELIIDSIIEAYVQVDADLRIRFMNANAERLLRKNRAEAVGQTFTDVVPDATRAHQWPQLVEAIQQEQRIEFSVFYPTQDLPSARAAAARLLEIGSAMVADEADNDGNLFMSRTDEVFLPQHDVGRIDATGAGDAMVGALAVALVEGRELRGADRHGADVREALTRTCPP